MTDLLETIGGALSQAASHEWVLRISLALLIAAVGIWLARWWAKAVDRLLLRLEVEQLLRSFLRNITYAIAVIVSLIAALDFAGVPTTSLLAVVGAAGLAIGLALKDSLSNIASGVMLIMLRPFRTGDFVQIAGLEGTIDSVRIFQTHLRTIDNRAIILPNSQITAEAIINYNAHGQRRIDLTVGIGYGDDLALARESLLALAKSNESVKHSPAPEVLVAKLGESSVELQLRCWVESTSYQPVKSELLEGVLRIFSQKLIRIPYPQREVHVYHHGDKTPVIDAAIDAGLGD